MLDSRSRKIVVIVGLAAVFGAIIFEFAARNGPGGPIAQSAPPPPAAASPAPPPSTNPPDSAPTLTQPTAQTAPVSSSPATAAPAAAPRPPASSVGDVAKSDAGPPAEAGSLTPAKPKASSHHPARRVAKTRHGDDTAETPAGSALASNVNSAAEGATNSPDGANSRSDGPPAPAATGTAATAGTPEATQQQPATAAPAHQEPVASDSQITADAKAQIATTAPDSDIHVTTTDGVIALAGSVPSQDAAERARQAALRVAGVKDVDASALKVSDQLR
jgi:hypothetical protein